LHIQHHAQLQHPYPVIRQGPKKIKSMAMRERERDVCFQSSVASILNQKRVLNFQS